MKPFYLFPFYVVLLWSCNSEPAPQADSEIQSSIYTHPVLIEEGMKLYDAPVRSAESFTVAESDSFYCSGLFNWMNEKPWLELFNQSGDVYWLYFEENYPQHQGLFRDTIFRKLYLDKILGTDIAVQLDGFERSLNIYADTSGIQLFDDLWILEQSIEARELTSSASLALLDYFVPYFLWSFEEEGILDLKKDYGFLCQSIQPPKGTDSDRLCELQFDYFPFDSTDYMYSSHYIVDASIIFSNLGDFNYINRLSTLDSLMALHQNSDFLKYCWAETSQGLLRRDIDYWQSKEKVFQELDSLLYNDWEQKDLSLLLEIEALKRYFKEEGREAHLFDKRSG